MSMYNLIEYNNDYTKLYGSLQQFSRDQPNNVITESQSFKPKSKFLDNTNNAGIIVVPFCGVIFAELLKCT